MWCGLVDNCPVTEGDDVTVGCYVQYEWLSNLLQYNPIVSLNTTLQFIEDRRTFEGPQTPQVPLRGTGAAPKVPDSEYINTTYTIRNVKPNQIIEATCMVDFLFDKSTAYSGRNTYADNPLNYTCRVRQPVNCKYLSSFLPHDYLTQRRIMLRERELVPLSVRVHNHQNSETSSNGFYPLDAMLARVFAIATCLDVRLSVRSSHAGIVPSRAKAGS